MSYMKNIVIDIENAKRQIAEILAEIEKNNNIEVKDIGIKDGEIEISTNLDE